MSKSHNNISLWVKRDASILALFLLNTFTNRNNKLKDFTSIVIGFHERFVVLHVGKMPVHVNVSRKLRKQWQWKRRSSILAHSTKTKSPNWNHQSVQTWNRLLWQRSLPVLPSGVAGWILIHCLPNITRSNFKRHIFSTPNFS